MDTCHFREAAEERLLSTMFPVERRRATLISWGEAQTEKETWHRKTSSNGTQICVDHVGDHSFTPEKLPEKVQVRSRWSVEIYDYPRHLHGSFILKKLNVDGLKVRMGFVARLKRSATWLFLAQDWCRRQGWSRWDIYGIVWDVPRSGAKWMWARWYRQTV